jgi:hypothetical protein
MADKPTIPDFPTLPDFGQMIAQACEVVASVRGIPYDFNGTLSLENKFVVLFKTVKEMFDAQDELVKSYKTLYDFVNNYFSNLDVQEEINNKITDMAKTGKLTNLILPYIKASPVIVNSLDEMINHDYIYLLTTDGYLYSWNGNTFGKSGINYTFPANAYVQKTYRFMTNADSILSLNECGSYTIGVVDGNNAPADMPPGWTYGNYMVVVDGYMGNDKVNFIQKMYRKGEERYNYRIINNNAPGEWVTIDFNEYKHYPYRFMTSADLISSLTDCGSYSIGVKDGDNVPADMPPGWTYGNYMVIVAGYMGNDKANFIQKMYRKGEERYNYRIINNSVPGKWVTINVGTSSKKIKVALCGDSFIDRGGDGGLPMSEYLNEFTKYDATSLAQGGIKASEWWETFKNKVTNEFDVFLLSLGLNSETSTDIFTNSINNIIDNITAKNPTARIILWCMDAWYTKEYSDACSNIAMQRGIEFYSMKANKSIPIRIGGKFTSVFPTLNNDYANAKTKAYSISATDNHPNIKARKMLAEFWSTII